MQGMEGREAINYIKYFVHTQRAFYHHHKQLSNSDEMNYRDVRIIYILYYIKYFVHTQRVWSVEKHRRESDKTNPRTAQRVCYSHCSMNYMIVFIYSDLYTILY